MPRSRTKALYLCFFLTTLHNYHVLCLFVLTVPVCVSDGVNVIVREKHRFAMLFQSVVLPCQYQTSSTQTPVVQWYYRSYCRDRTRESFTPLERLGMQTSELGSKSHLECADSSRTVRIVASAQGASMTLAEHYKGRDISIINSNEIILKLLERNSFRRKSWCSCLTSAGWQESELTVLCVSCFLNSHLLSLSYNEAETHNSQKHTDLQPYQD